MPNRIKPRRSYTASAVPTTSDLDTHELAVNWSDGKVFTKDTGGNIVSVTLGGTPDARWNFFLPPAPTGVSASSGNAQATVSWTAPTVLSQTPITDYIVQYSSTSGSSWTTAADGTSTSTSAVVTGLTNGTAYVFRVAAVTGIGQGAWSSASSAVTPAAGNILQTTAGLYAWYDASATNSVYSAQSGGSAVTADGGLIYRVEDLSGNGRHLYTFYSGSDVPRLAVSAKNGNNAILFDNSSRNDTFKSSANRESGTFNTGNPLTIFAVWFVESGRNNTYLFDDVRYSWFDRESSTMTGINLASGSVEVYQSGVSWRGSNSSRAGTWMVVRAVLNGTSSSLYVNGAADAPSSSSTSTDPGSINFFRASADIRLTGTYTLGELAFYSGALSNSTAASIESYLMSKWGIS